MSRDRAKGRPSLHAETPGADSLWSDSQVLNGNYCKEPGSRQQGWGALQGLPSCTSQASVPVGRGLRDLRSLLAPPHIQEEMEAQHGAETWRCPGLVEPELRAGVPALFVHRSSTGLRLLPPHCHWCLRPSRSPRGSHAFLVKDGCPTGLSIRLSR